ncbi:MAG: hypothetical protein K2K57_00015 [Oscillospiraceae bacterium]|nr:hypothetical protein [Oscillospiraceae bacterium]
MCYFTGRKNGKKILRRQAEERGTFITAHLTSSYKHRDSDTHEYEYHGEYQYEVNGKTKKYRTYSAGHLPSSIRMYPKNSAGTKFFSDYDGKKVNAAIGFNGLAGIAVGFAVYAAAIHFIYRDIIL